MDLATHSFSFALPDYGSLMLLEKNDSLQRFRIRLWHHWIQASPMRVPPHAAASLQEYVYSFFSSTPVSLTPCLDPAAKSASLHQLRCTGVGSVNEKIHPCQYCTTRRKLSFFLYFLFFSFSFFLFFLQVVVFEHD